MDHLELQLPMVFGSNFAANQQPRFKALMQRCLKELDRQADRIRTMLAEHDLDELLAPLIAMAEEADSGAD